MSYLIPDETRPPRCECGHPERGHADLEPERARWPRRCQAAEDCYCPEYRAREG